MALKDGLAALSRASAMWRVEPDSSSFATSRVRVRAGTPRTASIKANAPIPGIEAGSETFHFFPDQLIVRAGRRYAPISYADLKIETKTVDIRETSVVPPDSTIVRAIWRHARRDGGRDRRYRDNSVTHIVRYALVILAAGQYRVGLLVSSIQQAELFASAIQTVAHRFTARLVAARAPVATAPVTTVPAGQAKEPEPSRVCAPNVVLMVQAAATTAITGTGLVFRAGTVQPGSTVAKGSVISESPAAGTSVNAGSAVNLMVSCRPAQVSQAPPVPRARCSTVPRRAAVPRRRLEGDSQRGAGGRDSQQADPAAGSDQTLQRHGCGQCHQ